MKITSIILLPITRTAGWKELQQRRPSNPTLAWSLVLPMSLLPPILLYYAGTHYGDDFMAGFGDRQWRFITTILFLAELLTFFVMGWLIHAVVNATHELSIDYQNAYLLAALAPLPMWSASILLLIPSLLLNVIAELGALALSCSLIYHGLQALCERRSNDVVTMSATYTVMAAGVLAWGVLLGIILAF
ncbi:YIP1 family protein [Halomonas elongata]|uniref:YIP1 family protein n=1 Tax=Halomonas elongata TaxID=2746 RepID=UPI00186B8034|nr:YIP1 family protein [Halomonas elongata]MBW5801760.1 YIP1 family protein [Halomonas elongata]